MNAIDLEERKRLIIQEIEQVEDEQILKAIGKLLDLEDSELSLGKNKFSLSEKEWEKIERDDEDYQNGIGKNYTWEEVKNIVLKR